MTAASTFAADLRAWTVENSVALRQFRLQSGDGRGTGFFDGGQAVSPSPNGKYFFTVVESGDLAADARVAELVVFETDSLVQTLGVRGGKRPQPLRVARFASAWSDVFHEPIDAAFWETENTILFKGTQGRDESRVFRLDIASGELTPLTAPDHNAFSNFDAIGIRDRSIVYAASSKSDGEPTAAVGYPATAITGNELARSIGFALRGERSTLTRLFVSHEGAPIRAVMSLAPGSVAAGIWIAPNGRWAVVAAVPKDMLVPSAWKAYQRRASAWYRYMLVDLTSGAVKPILDAPVGPTVMSNTDVRALWSEDSGHVILANIALPLTDDAEVRASTSYLVDFDVASSVHHVIAPMPAESATIERLSWERNGQQFLLRMTLRNGQPAGAWSYEASRGKWMARVVKRSELPSVRSPAEQADLAGTEIDVRQSANDPPALIATRHRNSIDLLGPDPALQGVRLARLQEIEWPEPSSGKVITGGLMLPPGYVKGTPLPLVIQLYFYFPKQFTPDGVYSAAFAAQALAAQGIAVLFMDMPAAASMEVARKPYMTHWKTNSPAERRIVSENVDAAVDRLVSEGIVDRDRVGMIGWSRGGYLTHYLVTHAGKTRLAAAIVADAYTGSYGEYVVDAAMAPGAAVARQLSETVNKEYGQGTFWQNKEEWIREAPDFRADQVQTPTLFTMHGIEKCIFALETIGAWRLNRRPFEYVFLPDAAHEARRPRERYELMSAAVDWMGFWLQGRVPQDEGRRQRWQRIAEDWSDVRSREREALSLNHAAEATSGR